MGAGDRGRRHPPTGDAWLSLDHPRRPRDGCVVTPIAVLLAMTVAFALIALRWFRFDQAKTGWI